MKSPRQIAEEIVDNCYDPGDAVPYDKITNAIEQALAACEQREKVLLEACEFYSKGSHFEYCGKSEFEPESVSGEPTNWLCGGDEGSEFQIENGWVASEAIARQKELCEK